MATPDLFKPIDTSSLSYGGGMNVSAIAGMAQQLGLGGISLEGISLWDLEKYTNSIDAIASENPEQKAAGIQNLISQAMSIVTKLIGNGEAAAAAAEKAKEVKETNKLNTEAGELEAALDSKFKEISGVIDTETGVVTDLSKQAEDKQKELEEEQEKIQEIVNQINEAQARLGASTDPEEQKGILAEIQGNLLVQLNTSIGKVVELQSSVQELSTNVEESVNKIYENNEQAEKTESKGSSEIQTLVSGAAKQMQAKTTTEVKAVTNEAQGEAYQAAGEAAATNIFSGATIAPKLFMAASDQKIASTTRQACATVLHSLLQQGVGKIGNSASLIGSFSDTIGTAMGGYASIIDNNWNATIESFGSISEAITNMNVGEEAQQELNNAINTDWNTLEVSETEKWERVDNATQTSTQITFKGKQTSKVVNPYAQKKEEQTPAPTAPKQADDTNYGQTIENSEKDKKQANELKTPRVAFGI